MIKGVSRFFDFMFGCMHSNYSFPLTPKDRQHPEAASLTGSYVVCLECGREFPYDWRQMKIVTQPAPVQTPVTQPAEAFRSGDPVKSFANKAA